MAISFSLLPDKRVNYIFKAHANEMMVNTGIIDI